MNYIELKLWAKIASSVLVVIENPLVVTKDYEKEERFCPSTPR